MAIEPPELEMRVAILIKKAEPRGRRCPRKWPSSSPRTCAPTCASSKARCARSWPTRASTRRKSPSSWRARRCSDLLSIQNRQISVENIQKTVADYYKIKVADMYCKKRPASIARPRQIAMYLAKELTQKSLPEIGELFGGRDHTTVLHAVRKIGGERQQDDRTEPAAARAGADAERLSVPASACVEACSTTVGTIRHNRLLSTGAGVKAEVVPCRRAASTALDPQALRSRKCLMKQAKIAVVHR